MSDSRRHSKPKVTWFPLNAPRHFKKHTFLAAFLPSSYVFRLMIRSLITVILGLLQRTQRHLLAEDRTSVSHANINTCDGRGHQKDQRGPCRRRWEREEKSVTGRTCSRGCWAGNHRVIILQQASRGRCANLPNRKSVNESESQFFSLLLLYYLLKRNVWKGAIH